MRRFAVGLVVALIVTPPGAKAADLVVWWEKGFYAEEDEAVRETIAAFEQGTRKRSSWPSIRKRSFQARSRPRLSSVSRPISPSVRNRPR
jgi:hypothetical protein